MGRRNRLDRPTTLCGMERQHDAGIQAKIRFTYQQFRQQGNHCQFVVRKTIFHKLRNRQGIAQANRCDESNKRHRHDRPCPQRQLLYRTRHSEKTADWSIGCRPFRAQSFPPISRGPKRLAKLERIRCLSAYCRRLPFPNR